MAAERGVSVAELVREAIDRLPDPRGRAERWARALAVVGKGRDRLGATDLSLRHDEYLAEALGDDHVRRYLRVPRAPRR